MSCDAFFAGGKADDLFLFVSGFVGCLDCKLAG